MRVKTLNILNIFYFIFLVLFVLYLNNIQEGYGMFFCFLFLLFLLGSLSFQLHYVICNNNRGRILKILNNIDYYIKVLLFIFIYGINDLFLIHIALITIIITFIFSMTILNIVLKYNTSKILIDEEIILNHNNKNMVETLYLKLMLILIFTFTSMNNVFSNRKEVVIISVILYIKSAILYIIFLNKYRTFINKNLDVRDYKKIYFFRNMKNKKTAIYLFNLLVFHFAIISNFIVGFSTNYNNNSEGFTISFFNMIAILICIPILKSLNVKSNDERKN